MLHDGQRLDRFVVAGSAGRFQNARRVRFIAPMIGHPSPGVLWMMVDRSLSWVGPQADAHPLSLTSDCSARSWDAFVPIAMYGLACPKVERASQVAVRPSDHLAGCVYGRENVSHRDVEGDR